MTETPIERQDQGAWTKLRRRKVVQWGIAYAAGAWIVLQVIGFVADAFHWPDATKQVTTLALLVGLPIVLVLSWYHADRGQQRITTSEFAILTLLLLLGGGVFWYYQRTSETAMVGSSPPPIVPPSAPERSIAVLPLVNMSTDKNQEYFADGISEELLNLLAQVPELRVIARTSSFAFKGKDVGIGEIARILNVAHVLEGSVRRSGDKVRITAQLIRASDSSHLWSQTYDRSMTDVFAVQDEIAATVVEQLKIKLLNTVPKLRVTDPQAYALFLRAREIRWQFNSEAFEHAIDFYKQALAIDPTYAPAWDGLADVYYNQIDLGLTTTDEGLPLGRAAINQALANDSTYAPSYARAAVISVVEGNLAEAALRLEQGLALDPANLDIINAAATIARRLDRMNQALALAEHVVARDPVNADGHVSVAYACWYMGRIDKALQALKQVHKLSPKSDVYHEQAGEILLLKGDTEAALREIQHETTEHWRLVGLSMAYHALGRKAESDAALKELIGKYAQLMAYNIAYVLAYRGEADRAFEWLDKAIKTQDSGLATMTSYPVLRSLHSDPRWLTLLRRLGKAPDQLAAIKFDVTVPK